MKRAKLQISQVTQLFFLLAALAIFCFYPEQKARALDRLIEVLAVGVTDDVGLPLALGTVTTYDAGTTNLRTVFQDFDLLSSAGNPFTLDSAGRSIVYTNKRVKLVIKDSAGATVRTIDNVGTADADIATSAVAGGVTTNVPAGAIIPYVGNAAAPSGWLYTDGTTVSQIQYPALYAAIGTTFNTGGEAAGYFRLPATSRRVLIGAGGAGTATCSQGTDCTGTGIANALGSRGGAETHTMTTAEVASHTHTGTTASSVTSVSTGNATLPAMNASFYYANFVAGSGGAWDSFSQDDPASNGPIFQHSGGGRALRAADIVNIPSGAGIHAHSITDPGHTHTFTTGNGSGSSTAFNVMQPGLIVNYLIKY